MAQLNTHVKASFSDHQMTYLVNRFLDVLKKELQLEALGQKRDLPLHSGNVLKFNRWTLPTANTTALTDGVSPDGTTMSSSTVSTTINGYGAYVTISDFLQFTAINDTMKDSVDWLGYMAALSRDSLIRNELDANGTQRYTDPTNNSSKANVETGTDVIASSDLKIILRVMRKNDVKPFSDGLYRGVIHPLMEFDLISETAASSFIILSAHNGSAGRTLEKGEIGTAFNIKLLRSTNIRADATSTNTYGNIFVGENAFGVSNLSGKDTEIIVKPHGSAGTEDPLNQRATVGYKMYFGTKLLDANRAQILWAYNAG